MPESTLSPLPGRLKDKVTPLLVAMKNGSQKRESTTSKLFPSIYVGVHSTYARVLVAVALVRIFDRLLDHALLVDTYGIFFFGTLMTHLLGLRSWMKNAQLNYLVASGRLLD